MMSILRITNTQYSFQEQTGVGTKLKAIDSKHYDTIGIDDLVAMCQ